MMPNQENQYKLNDMYHHGDYMTSCQHLERRFLHSENQFMYICNEPDDGEGCPKTMRRGRATKCCLTDPYETRPIHANSDDDLKLGEDNNDRGDFNEK